MSLVLELLPPPTLLPALSPPVAPLAFCSTVLLSRTTCDITALGGIREEIDIRSRAEALDGREAAPVQEK